MRITLGVTDWVLATTERYRTNDKAVQKCWGLSISMMWITFLIGADKIHPLGVHIYVGWQDFRRQHVIFSWITFATESLAGCLSTVQCGELRKTGVVVGGIVGRPNSIGGGRTHTPPHGGGAPLTLTTCNYF